MVWARNLVTELILPSTGTPGIGSGVFYIGPNLPPEMQAAGYESAMIWWSDETDYDNTHVQYQYIGYKPGTAALKTMRVEHGFMGTGVGLVVQQAWVARNISGGNYVEMDVGFYVNTISANGSGGLDYTTLQVDEAILAYNRTDNQDGFSENLQIDTANGLQYWETDVSTEKVGQFDVVANDLSNLNTRLHLRRYVPPGSFPNVIDANWSLTDTDAVASLIVPSASIVDTATTNSAQQLNTVGTNNTNVLATNALAALIASYGPAIVAGAQCISSSARFVAQNGTSVVTAIANATNAVETITAGSNSVTTTVDSSNAVQAFSVASGDHAYITTNEVGIDAWQGPFVINGSAGGTTYTSNTWFRVSFDRTVLVLGNIAFAATPVGASLNCVLGGPIPQMSAPPSYPLNQDIPTVLLDGTARIPRGGFLSTDVSWLKIRNTLTSAQVYFNGMYLTDHP